MNPQDICWRGRMEWIDLAQERHKRHTLENVVMKFYVYGSVHHNIFYEITNRCSYMQSNLFHC